MNKLEDFNKIIIKNNENKFIVEELIQYFMYIYTSFVTNKKIKNKYIKIKIDSEADIFKELLLKYIPPNKR